MTTIDEKALEKADRLCIDIELFEQVEDYKLEKEIERLEEKRERLIKIRNESLDRVILKINNIKNYLENKNI
jgi:hypothetical protein